jgi:apolipoprotein N-acyltransferase
MALYIAVTCAIAGVFIRQYAWRGLLLFPAAWVAAEYLRGIVLGGFPWIPLGNTMVTLLPIAQLASVLGVFGLSLLVAYLNVGFAIAAMTAPTSPASARAAAGPARFASRAWVAPAAVTLGAIAVVSVWGGMRLSANALTTGAPIKIGLIQGNIAQTDKWNPARAGMILERYLQLTRQASDNGAQFIMWPESSKRIRAALSCAIWYALSASRSCSAATSSNTANRPAITTLRSCSIRMALPPPYIERFTSFRSGSTCLFSGCCFLLDRWWKRCRPFRAAPGSR